MVFKCIVVRRLCRFIVVGGGGDNDFDRGSLLMRAENEKYDIFTISGWYETQRKKNKIYFTWLGF